MPRPLDIAGHRFGRLVAVATTGTVPRRWRCACDCGGEAVLSVGVLRSGNTTSCGCAHREMVAALGRSSLRHGHAAGGSCSPTFNTWHSMLQRAHAGSCKDAARYLHAGITVCERWLSFDAFLADMGERPEGTTLDRIDGTKGYEPGNCRWATASQQARNRSSAFFVTALGRTQHLTDWAAETGMSHQAIRHRLRAGWAPDDAVTVPIDHGNKIQASGRIGRPVRRCATQARTG